MMNSVFLPTSLKEINALGWESADIILFTGDAYVDHPAFGAAVIGRVLENEGYKVAIVPQPNWRDDLRDFRKLGRPKLFFAVTSGNMDSMVNHYTANLRLRSTDAYSAGGKAGFRPDYAITTYCNILKKLYPEVPIVIGGIEASLRRLTHYDYWSDTLKPSILIDSHADILVYGMGEQPIVEITRQVANGKAPSELKNIPQTAFFVANIPEVAADSSLIELHSYEDCIKSKKYFAENFKLFERESNKLVQKTIVEPVGDGFVVVNPPYPPPAVGEIDKWYALPYTRLPHPRYKGKDIPAWEMIKFSVNIHRGCFGGCSFCTISAHQGKFIASRSEKSVLREVEQVIEMPGFKGYLSDIGGPSANMYMMGGIKREKCRECTRYSCIYPSICLNLNASHSAANNLYIKIRSMHGVKKAFVSSGVRYDLFTGRNTQAEKDYFENLCRFHISGRLKVAPEHTSEKVLKLMRKPSFRKFRQFKTEFDLINKKYALNQQLIPYFISSHPGSTEADMQELAREIKELNIRPEQVQDFTPTPMTLASAMYYTGINPYTGEKIYVARSRKEKLKQNSYFFWYKAQNTKGS